MSEAELLGLILGGFLFGLFVLRLITSTDDKYHPW